jgi:hypothetical protein
MERIVKSILHLWNEAATDEIQSFCKRKMLKANRDVAIVWSFGPAKENLECARDFIMCQKLLLFLQ